MFQSNKLGESLFDWDVPAMELEADPKMFQNLNVSSAEADTIMSPSGDLAR